MRNIGHEYMLGDSLLVAPVFDQDEFSVYLPEGTWADFFTGRLIEGGRWISLQPALDQIPVYIRPNTIVPMLASDVCRGLEEPYKDLTVCMNLKDRLSCTFYDDGYKGHFTAELRNGCLRITTGMPVKEIILYGAEAVEEASCNGLPVTCIKKDEYTHLLHL